MLQQFQGLFGDKEENSETLINQNQYPDVVDSPIELADSLWQRGEIQQALDLYTEEIQKNPNSQEIMLNLAKLLQQQHNISESYKKLAEVLKKQGKIDQAAEYYRQTIVLKSLIHKTTNKTFQASNSYNLQHSSYPIDDLSDNAFSFVSSLASIPQLVNIQRKTLPSQILSDKSHTPSLPSQEVNSTGNTKIAWETAQLYIEQALDGYDNSQWQEAASACQKILEIFPEMAETYKILGNALQRMGDTGKAMECYAKGLKIQPDLAVVYAGIGNLYYQQQKWLKAKEYYQKATIINPRYSKAYRNLAEVWQQLGQPMKAEFCKQRAASIDSELSPNSLPSAPEDNLLPDSTQTSPTVETCYKLAQNSAQNQKWQEAAFYYRKALELNNTSLNSTANNGFTLNSPKLPINISDSQSQLERAIQRYRYQAQVKPSSAKIQFTLGNLYAQNQQWEEAIASYQQAIKIEPRYGKVYLNLAKALVKVGKEAESVEQLYFAYTIKPELADADSLFNLGKALVKEGDRQRAINCYSLALDLKPDFLTAYHKLAETLIQLGRRQEAIECYRNAVKNNPHDTDAYFFLGEQLTAIQQWDNAVQAYRRVLELQPKYSQASHKLNYALAEKLKLELAHRR